MSHFSGDAVTQQSEFRKKEGDYHSDSWHLNLISEFIAMSISKHSERRKFPRFNVQVPLNLSLSRAKVEETLDATSINVSMNGVYCIVNRYLPLFDKVLITFVIPEGTEDPYNIISQCEGVVVRVEPENEEPGRAEYKVALYFHNLSQEERNLLHTLIITHS